MAKSAKIYKAQRICKSHLLTQGRLDLKALHGKRIACRLQADKGYGPCLLLYGHVRDFYRNLQTSSQFVSISGLHYGQLLFNSQTALYCVVDRAWALDWISAKTHAYILQPFRDLDSDVSSYAGTIRFMSKLHKVFTFSEDEQLLDLTCRRVESDSRSTWRPTAKREACASGRVSPW